MAREHIILECTEARAEGKPVSRYMSTRDKKQQPDRVEKKKYNKFLRRHTLHREIKSWANQWDFSLNPPQLAGFFMRFAYLLKIYLSAIAQFKKLLISLNG